jgi:hypothetical protein
VSLNADEPTMALAPAPPLAADGEEAALAAELAALLGALAGADELFDGEEHAASASAPAVTARPAAIFLFIRDLLVLLSEQESDKRRDPLTRCSRLNCLPFVNFRLLSVIAKRMTTLSIMSRYKDWIVTIIVRCMAKRA